MGVAESEPARTIIGLILVIGASIIYLHSGPTWNTHESAVTIFSILAFLAAVTTGASYGRVRLDDAVFHRVFSATMAYIFLINLISTIPNLFMRTLPVMQTNLSGIFIQIVHHSIIATLLLSSSILRSWELKESSMWRKRLIVPALLIAALIIWFLVLTIAHLIPADSIFIVAGYVLGAYAMGAFFISGIIRITQSHLHRSHNPLRMLVGCILLTASTFALIAVVAHPSVLWMMSVIFQAAALVFFLIGSANPFFADVGVENKLVTWGVAIISALILAPLIIATIFEKWFSFTYFVGLGATFLVHLGAVFFAATTGVILYTRSKERGTWHLAPVVFLLISWAITEFAIILARHIPIYGLVVESKISYVIGGFAAIACLTDAIRKLLTPLEEEKQAFAYRYHLPGYIGIGFGLILGEWVFSHVTSGISPSLSAALGSVLLILLGCAGIFLLVNFIMLLAAESGGELTLELMTIGSLCVWFIGFIFRANYADWTAGWWAAEALLLVVVMPFPITLSILFVQERNRANDLAERALLYAEVVGKEIAGQQKSVIDDLYKLTSELGVTDTGLAILSSALANASKANELTELTTDNLARGKRFTADELEPTDVIASLKMAVDQLQAAMPSTESAVEVTGELGVHFVEGNRLLSTLFLVLLRAVITRITPVPVISISAESAKDLESSLSVNVVVELPSSIIEQKIELFSRYLRNDRPGGLDFAFVRKLTDLYSGDIEVVGSRDSLGIDRAVFAVHLPAATLT